MKWLLLFDDAKKASMVHNFIAACGPKDTIVEFNLVGMLIDRLIPLLKACDHCVIFFTGETLLGGATAFTAGYCTGKGIVVYGVGNRAVLMNAGIPAVACYETETAFFDYLRKSYRTLQREQNRFDAYRYLFDHGVPFTPDSFASCITQDKTTLCHYFVVAGMGVNVRTSDGTPMLNVASRAENIVVAEWLLKNGADVNAVSDDRGYTAIMDAVWRGNKELVQLFIDWNAELDTVSKEGQTMLVLAVGMGRKDICQILTENGENPDIEDAMGMSAYAYAKLFKRDDIVAILEANHKGD
ncbi:MAG: ankyrin repeat domain-containing protein [Treponema sp.]|nr:ankyrin repeat domain-containing protein [Treponema sp.]